MMSEELFSMPSRCPAAVSPQPDNGVGSFAAPQQLTCIGKASIAPAPQTDAGPTLLRDRDVRRHLRRRCSNADENALARLCMEELDEQSAAVVDRGDFCLHVGRRLLRRLGI